MHIIYMDRYKYIMSSNLKNQQNLSKLSIALDKLHVHEDDL